MNSVSRLAFAGLLAGAVAALPVLGSGPQGLVGVARGSGAIQINGQQFEGEGSLFTGDQIRTGAASPLTVVSSPAERMRFEALTSAQVTKLNRATLIRLSSGAIDFQSSGAIEADLAYGISVRPLASTVTLAQVSQLTNGSAQVAVYKGSVEVADADEAITVTAGHTATISPSATSNATNDQNSDKNKKKKKLWAIFISTGLSAGATAAILAKEPSSNISAVDP